MNKEIKSDGLGTDDEAKPKLSREQQRKIEAIEKDAHQTITRLSEKFFDFFMQSDDPEGPEVEAKRIQLCSQWKMYCFRKKLTAQAYTLLDDDCKTIMKAYWASKEPQPAPERVEVSGPVVELKPWPNIETVSPAY